MSATTGYSSVDSVVAAQPGKSMAANERVISQKEQDEYESVFHLYKYTKLEETRD